MMINLNEHSILKMAHDDAIENPAVQKASDQDPKNSESLIYGEIQKSVHKLEEEFEKVRLEVIKGTDRISKRMRDWRSESESICSSPGLKDEVQLEWAHKRDEVVQKRVEAMRARLSLQKFKSAFKPPIEEFENAELPLDEIGPLNNKKWIAAFLFIDGFLAYSQWRVSEGVTGALFVTVGFALLSLLGNIFLASKYKQHKAHTLYAHKWIWPVIAILANYAVLNLIHWARNAQSDLDAPIYFAWLTTYVPPTVNETTKALMERFGMDVGKTSFESINAVFFLLTYFLNLFLFIKLGGFFEKYDGYSLKKYDYEYKTKSSIDAHHVFKKTLDTYFDAKKKAIDTHILGAKAIENDLASLNESFQNNMKKYQGYLTNLDAEARKYISLYRAKWQEVAGFAKACPQFWSKEFTIHSIKYKANLKEIFTPDDPMNKSVIVDINNLKSKFENQSNEEHNIKEKLNSRKTQYIKECTDLINLAPTLEKIDSEAHTIISRDEDKANKVPMEHL